MIASIIARFCTELFLIRHGRWCEDSGDPMNAFAEEFDRRDALAAKENS